VCWRACSGSPTGSGSGASCSPLDDAGAIFLAEYGRDLRRWFLFPDPPADLPRRLAGKYSLHELCREFGIASPRTVAPDSLRTAREFASARRVSA